MRYILILGLLLIVGCSGQATAQQPTNTVEPTVTVEGAGGAGRPRLDPEIRALMRRVDELEDCMAMLIEEIDRHTHDELGHLYPARPDWNIYKLLPCK